MKQAFIIAVAVSVGWWLKTAENYLYDRALNAAPIERLHP